MVECIQPSSRAEASTGCLEMKQKQGQLEMFVADRPAFQLTGDVLETAVCSKCGRVIVVRERLPDGIVMSEYVGRDGRCYACSMRS